jgi:hypothetical protein
VPCFVSESVSQSHQQRASLEAHDVVGLAELVVEKHLPVPELADVCSEDWVEVGQAAADNVPLLV